MKNQMIFEKQKQAVEILNEKNIDMWMTFVRETGNIKDPMMDMIVVHGKPWVMASSNPYQAVSPLLVSKIRSKLWLNIALK